MNAIEHLFMKAAEEGGEVSQAASKCGIFGPYDLNPKNRDVAIERLVAEVNDLIGVIEMLGDHGFDVSELGDREQISLKKQKVLKWMDYARARGTLT